MILVTGPRCTRGRKNSIGFDAVNTIKNKELNFLFLNVCGLKSKLKFQEFNDIVQKYDACFFVESKLDDLDVIEVPNGYTYVTKNRKKMAKNQVVL